MSTFKTSFEEEELIHAAFNIADFLKQSFRTFKHLKKNSFKVTFL